VVVVAAAGLAYLRDPPWIGAMTSGLGRWEEDPPGTRFRWTQGRASFFVPADAAAITIPLRAVFPGPLGGAVLVDVRADDRWLATIRLPQPDAWVLTTLPLGGRAPTRRHRRIDLRVNRVVPPFMLGVMVGEVRIESSGRSG
jgi:hypothetical protein